MQGWREEEKKGGFNPSLRVTRLRASQWWSSCGVRMVPRHPSCNWGSAGQRDTALPVGMTPLRGARVELLQLQFRGFCKWGILRGLDFMAALCHWSSPKQMAACGLDGSVYTAPGSEPPSVSQQTHPSSAEKSRVDLVALAEVRAGCSSPSQPDPRGLSLSGWSEPRPVPQCPHCSFQCPRSSQASVKLPAAV